MPRSGDGPPLLKTANWLNHLEFDWKSPVWQHWFGCLVRLTIACIATISAARACPTGVTTPTSRSTTQVADLELHRRFRGPRSIRAARHFAGRRHRHRICRAPSGAREPPRDPRRLFARLGSTRPESLRMGRALAELMRLGWGIEPSAFRRMFAELLIPQASEEQVSWFSELQRRTTTGEIAARILEATGVIDVTRPHETREGAHAGPASARRHDGAVRSGPHHRGGDPRRKVRRARDQQPRAHRE